MGRRTTGPSPNPCTLPMLLLLLLGARVAQWVRSLELATHTSLSPIRRGFKPGFVNYKKGCTQLAAACDKVYQLLTRGLWFSPGTPASSTTKTGHHDSSLKRPFNICTVFSHFMKLYKRAYETSLYLTKTTMNRTNTPIFIAINSNTSSYQCSRYRQLMKIGMSPTLYLIFVRILWNTQTKKWIIIITKSINTPSGFASKNLMTFYRILFPGWSF